jgi:excisionase family DNA binding protein
MRRNYQPRGVIEMFEQLIEKVKGKMLSPDSTGALLELSRSQIHRLLKQKEIEAVKLGSRTTRITGDSIAAYLERKSNVIRKPVCIKKIKTVTSA